MIRAHHRALVEPGQSPSKPNRKRHGTTAGSQSHRRTPTVQPTPRRIPWATRQREGPPRRVQRRRRVRPAAGAESTRGRRRQRRRGPDSCRQGRPFGGRVSTPQATVSLARYLFLFRRMMNRHDLQLGNSTLHHHADYGDWNSISHHPMLIMSNVRVKKIIIGDVYVFCPRLIQRFLSSVHGSTVHLW